MRTCLEQTDHIFTPAFSAVLHLLHNFLDTLSVEVNNETLVSSEQVKGALVDEEDVDFAEAGLRAQPSENTPAIVTCSGISDCHELRSL